MTKYSLHTYVEINTNPSYALGNMGELLTKGNHYKDQRVDGVVDGDEVQARGDEEGGHRAPAPGVRMRHPEEAAASRHGGARRRRRRRQPLGAEAPCPFFLDDGACVDKFLPLLGCCQEGGISWLCLGALQK